MISGIIFVIRNGLRWRDAPSDFGPNNAIYDRIGRTKGGLTSKLHAVCDGKERQLVLLVRAASA